MEKYKITNFKQEAHLKYRILMKLECTIADKTTLWESQISFVQDEKTYKVEHGRIQTFKGEKYTTLNENSIITFSDYKINIPTDFFKTTEQETSRDDIERFRRYARCKSSKNNYQIYKAKFMCVKYVPLDS